MSFATFEQRFWAKVDKTDDCWFWTGAKSTAGYGQLRVNGRSEGAHRLAYELTFGRPVPSGLQIDHLCRRPNCIRPEHLEAVTPRENARRGIKGVLTTHCPHGHEYTPENTIIHKRTGRGDSRECRTCNAIRDRIRHKVKAIE